MTPLRPESGARAGPGRLLAFDTSTERLAVAVQGPAGRLTADEAGGAAASSALLPCIERLLDQAGLGWADLDAIAFGHGPGAFTGLRTSCAVAQGLAVGLAKPLLPIDSLLIVAEDARQQAAPGAPILDIDIVMDARMGEVYTGRFAWHEGRWAATTAATLESPQALFARWRGRPPAALAGSALSALPDWPWCEAAPADRQWPGEASRANALIALAEAGWFAGATVEASQALPTYLRNKVALTTAERDAARRAAATAA
jgi:tRNA threonylcarbamoyladenosine biosynthesis protein TsaB